LPLQGVQGRKKKKRPFGTHRRNLVTSWEFNRIEGRVGKREGTEAREKPPAVTKIKKWSRRAATAGGPGAPAKGSRGGRYTGQEATQVQLSCGEKLGGARDLEGEASVPHMKADIRPLARHKKPFQKKKKTASYCHNRNALKKVNRERQA